jgi:hypothetical protein
VVNIVEVMSFAQKKSRKKRDFLYGE